MIGRLAVCLLALAACKNDGPAAPAPATDAAERAPAGESGSAMGTPNAFLAGGAPTFIAGTSGGDREDRAVRGQIEMLRGLLFPDAKVLTDGEVTDAWPERPVIYGGPHVNAVTQRLAPGLPFELAPGRLKLGELVLEGDSYQLVTVLPARTEAPAHPELLLYAGTGTPGIREINGVSKGAEAIMIADEFGPLYTGHWVRGPDGALKAELGKPVVRTKWRSSAGTHATLRFPEQLPTHPREADLVAAAAKGVEQAAAALGLGQYEPLVLYVYPESRSKAAITGKSGDGHAVANARVLHIAAAGHLRPSDVTRLVAHEATHVLQHDGFGPAGTPFMAEGLAVWVAGAYGGATLPELLTQVKFKPAPSVRQLLGPTFRSTDEKIAYPLAGLFVDTAVQVVGRDKVLAHLLPATAATWDEACKAAGTTAEDLQTKLGEKLQVPRGP